MRGLPAILWQEFGAKLHDNRRLPLYCSLNPDLLRLNDISLYQFRTYSQSSFIFSERITAVCGKNGVGKTNLLDAIYYLCFTKSFFSKSDQQNVRQGFAGFRLEGSFLRDGKEENVICILRETGKKEFLINGEPYEKFSSHIGRFPCVMVTPDEVEIIAGGSEGRRRFMDTLFCQLDPLYLQQLIEYNRVLQQRNSFLKAQTDTNRVNTQLLDIYDMQLSRPGELIFEKRKTYMKELLPQVQGLYNEIAGYSEEIDLSYVSHLSEGSFIKVLRDFRQKDLLLQRTNKGIHKDELEISLHTQPFKSAASQGQRKSLLFAMKLAEFQMLKEEKKYAPILLLDDVFEKLDEQRMFHLLDRVCLLNDGQIFITDTHSERICTHFEKLKVNYQLINL